MRRNIASVIILQLIQHLCSITFSLPLSSSFNDPKHTHFLYIHWLNKFKETAPKFLYWRTEIFCVDYFFLALVKSLMDLWTLSIRTYYIYWNQFLSHFMKWGIHKWRHGLCEERSASIFRGLNDKKRYDGGRGAKLLKIVWRH